VDRVVPQELVPVGLAAELHLAQDSPVVLIALRHQAELVRSRTRHALALVGRHQLLGTRAVLGVDVGAGLALRLELIVVHDDGPAHHPLSAHQHRLGKVDDRLVPSGVAGGRRRDASQVQEPESGEQNEEARTHYPPPGEQSADDLIFRLRRLLAALAEPRPDGSL
jgi:hypothetical protein